MNAFTENGVQATSAYERQIPLSTSANRLVVAMQAEHVLSDFM